MLNQGSEEQILQETIWLFVCVQENFRLSDLRLEILDLSTMLVGDVSLYQSKLLVRCQYSYSSGTWVL